MALAVDLVGLGMPNDLATLLGQSDLTAITAAGTSQGTATTLNASNSIVTAASTSAQGVVLPSTASLTRLFFVQNSPSSGAALNVYPPSGARFPGLSANLPVSIPVGGFAIFDKQSSTYFGAVTSFGSTTGGTIPAANLTVSPRTIAIGGLVPAVSTDFTDTAPVTTEVYFGEILVPCNMTVTGVALFNGSNVTGNVQVMLYNSAGTLVANSAAAGTAGSGTDTYQLVPFTATAAITGPATYFIASAYSSATARYNAPPLGAFATGKATGQVFGTAPATITPPTTFTANLCNIASLY